MVDEEDAVVDIVTQSMLVDFLWQNLERIGDAAQAKVRFPLNPCTPANPSRSA